MASGAFGKVCERPIQMYPDAGHDFEGGERLVCRLSDERSPMADERYFLFQFV
jgi:hypothetical protein